MAKSHGVIVHGAVEIPLHLVADVVSGMGAGKMVCKAMQEASPRRN